MSVQDALNWERDMKMDGWLIENPEEEHGLLSRPDFLKQYGPEALLKAYLAKDRIGPAQQLAEEYPALDSAEIEIAEVRVALSKLTPREKDLLRI